MTPNLPEPVYKAGLTRWETPRDLQAGARAPQVPDDPGPIHAVRPTTRELTMRGPSFLEDTYNYRAALCGARVKVVMPNSFKPTETGACQDCADEASKPVPSKFLHPKGGITTAFTDRWNPARWRRLSRKRQAK